MTIFERKNAILRITLGILLLGSLGLAESIPLSNSRFSEPGVKIAKSGEKGLVLSIALENYGIEDSRFSTGFTKIIIPGFGYRSVPGEPSLPTKKLLVALPPSGGYSISYRVISEKNLGKLRIEPVPFPGLINDGLGGVLPGESFVMIDSVYSRYKPQEPVTMGSVARIRHQRVLPVHINPVLFDPETGGTRIITDLRVEIVFTQQPMRNIRTVWEQVEEPPVWDRIISSAVVNPAASKKWRARRKQSSFRPESGSRGFQTSPLIKLRVRKTGLFKIRASSLISGGFPAGMSVSEVRLFKRYYDEAKMSGEETAVPVLIKEDSGGIPGVFDGSDWLIFYALRLRDDPIQGDPVEKFSDYNVYWVSADSGLSMQSVHLSPGYISADTAVVSFPVRELYDIDKYFQEQTPETLSGENPLTMDSYYFNSPFANSLSAPFSVHAVKPGTTLKVQAEFIGGNLANTTIRELLIAIENGKGTVNLNSTFVSGNNIVQYTSQPVPSYLLDEGMNTLKVTPSFERQTLNALLRRFYVEYQSLYVSDGDYLRFNTASLMGDTSLTVLGLTRKDLLLFDVTDPFNSKDCVLGDSLFTSTGAGYALSFREFLSGTRDFILTPMDSISELSPADIVMDTPGNIIGNPAEGGVDILVISHRDFLDEMRRWVDYRRAQGYRVLMVDVEDVFDEYNGGVPGAPAIKRFIRYYYEKAGASFVVLVGDASEDNKRVHADSGPNFVPTQSYQERIQSYPFNEDEIVTSDKWYVLMDNDYYADRGDYYPDLIIGRLPAGTLKELQIMLDKTFAFESPTASEFWRRRMIQVADDAWSVKGFTNETCFRETELDFERGEEQVSRMVEASLAGGFEVVREYLSKYTSVVHPVNSGCADNEVVKSYTRANALPELLDEIEKGATLLSIQAHMNRYLITHETLFSSSNAIGRDHYKLQNFGRPFIIFAMGCHLSDYAINRELARVGENDVNGDCIDELLLLLKNRGAVATYGSSGFEYLGENVFYTGAIYRTFFNNPPTDTMIASDRAQARWIFGEIMTLSEIRAASPGQIRRYHILGDPLLRIDAGPPRFEVTMNGAPVNSGDAVISGLGDSILVDAIVSDENAIEKFSLTIDGVDESSQLSVTPLADNGLSASRKYRVTFSHRLLPKSYDIVLRAFQAPDTTAGSYHMAAEFVLKVPLEILVEMNGRPVTDGDFVPEEGNYTISFDFPVAIDPSNIRIEMDSVVVDPVYFSYSTQGDSTLLLASFQRQLEEGRHLLKVYFSGYELLALNLNVSLVQGLDQLIAYPNPFSNNVYFVFSNYVDIEGGRIDIYTTSGKKIASLPVPPASRLPGQNAVRWDGRDFAGDRIANGLYLYTVTVVQRGKSHSYTGKLAKIE